MKRSKIGRHIRLYDFRHHFVTEALQRGADTKALADLVGSRPGTLIRHYQHVAKRLHRETVQKISKIRTNFDDTVSPKKKKGPVENRP